MAASLICCDTQSRVSSVLNRDVKQFGKKYMFDCNEETCWNSDQGDFQWVIIDFSQPVKVSELKVQFQGGFSGKTCRLEGSQKDGDFMKMSDFYPEDDNSLQSERDLPFASPNVGMLQHLKNYNGNASFPIQDAHVVHKLKIVFENSADFFGRIIVYSLDVLGEQAL